MAQALVASPRPAAPAAVARRHAAQGPAGPLCLGSEVLVQVLQVGPAHAMFGFGGLLFS